MWQIIALLECIVIEVNTILTWDLSTLNKINKQHIRVNSSNKVQPQERPENRRIKQIAKFGLLSFYFSGLSSEWDGQDKLAGKLVPDEHRKDWKLQVFQPSLMLQC